MTLKLCLHGLLASKIQQHSMRRRLARFQRVIVTFSVEKREIGQIVHGPVAHCRTPFAKRVDQVHKQEINECVVPAERVGFGIAGARIGSEFHGNDQKADQSGILPHQRVECGRHQPRVRNSDLKRSEFFARSGRCSRQCIIGREALLDCEKVFGETDIRSIAALTFDEFMLLVDLPLNRTPGDVGGHQRYACAKYIASEADPIGQFDLVSRDDDGQPDREQHRQCGRESDQACRTKSFGCGPHRRNIADVSFFVEGGLS